MAETITWTQAEMAAFDQLTRKLSSLRQMDRITARVDMKHFVDEHGKAKCDAMFDELRRFDKR